MHTPQKMKSTKSIVNYFFEIGVLSKELNDGLKLAGVTNLDSIAEHALRAAQIGYILTALENEKHNLNLNPERVASIIIFHDNAEVRIGDLHKVASRYIDSRKAEKKAFEEQTGCLPREIKEKLVGYFNEIEERTTREGIIAKDADWLERAFLAKEHYDLGNKLALEWVNGIGRALETDSAKEIFKMMKKTKFTDWWSGLQKNLHTKLDGTNIVHGKNSK
jgi:putative hydrolase of HD superfamily